MNEIKDRPMRLGYVRKNDSEYIYIYIYIYIHIYPTPPLGQDMTQGQFFKRSLTGLNSEFSFS